MTPLAGAATDNVGVVARAADAEVLVLPGGSSLQLLAEGDGTSETMTVHRATVRAGALGASPHHHIETTELLYVLSGSLQVLVGDEIVRADEGDAVVIPPGVAHAFAATADSDAELLDVVTPGRKRFEMFRRMFETATASDLGSDQRAAAFSREGSSHDTYTDDSAAWGERLPNR
jgi:mannose-6-phosphate isomerase-like protein (cupin superfamily)